MVNNNSDNYIKLLFFLLSYTTFFYAGWSGTLREDIRVICGAMTLYQASVFDVTCDSSNPQQQYDSSLQYGYGLVQIVSRLSSEANPDTYQVVEVSDGKILPGSRDFGIDVAAAYREVSWLVESKKRQEKFDQKQLQKKAEKSVVDIQPKNLYAVTVLSWPGIFEQSWSNQD